MEVELVMDRLLDDNSIVDELEDAVCGLLEVISRGMNQNGSLNLHDHLLV